MIRKHRPNKNPDGHACGRSNSARARDAYRTLVAYDGNRRLETDPELVRDLIGDLMHLCDSRKIDFDYELRMAFLLYSDESGNHVTFESMLACHKLEVE